MTQPGFEIRDERFFEVIEKGTELQVLADGFVFTEGPIWHPHEEWLVFSDIAASKQYRWSPVSGLELFRTPSNQANGNCLDGEGRVISCEHASSALVRHEHDGKMVVAIATHYQGKELNSPNDVVCDAKGRIWFTDPAYGRMREDLGILREQQQPHQGVYRLDPDGELTLVADDFQQPNGLCLSLDETMLYVNDSPAGVIRRFDIGDDGTLSGGAVWAPVTGESPWVPDGMKLDLEGHLFCNGPAGVHVFGPDGTCFGVIRFPEKSTNFCFGGADRSTLFVTASTRLYAVHTKVRGPSYLPGEYGPAD